MSDDAIDVMRGASGTSHGNTVIYKTVLLYFQRYPGTDPASGIANEPYVFSIGGSVVARGKLGAQGDVRLQLPAGGVGTLEIFGSQYEITVRATIEAFNTEKGTQRRLFMLGYQTGAIDGILGLKTDRETLNFQADNNPLAIDGVAGPKTHNQLKTKVGE